MPEFGVFKASALRPRTGPPRLISPNLRRHAATKTNEGNQYYGLASGFVIVAGGYAGGDVSGGAFNPAVAFGIGAPSAGLGFGRSFA